MPRPPFRADHVGSYLRPERLREARERFAAEGQDYKVELIDDLVATEGLKTVSLYTNGPFTDLCRGPHTPSTAAVQAARSPIRRPGPGCGPASTRSYGPASRSRTYRQCAGPGSRV